MPVITTKRLHEQRSFTLSSRHKHAAMISDAEAHNTQKMDLLLSLKPPRATLRPLTLRWNALKDKFNLRAAFLSQISSFFDSLIEITGNAEELDQLWGKVVGGNVHPAALDIWQTRINATTQRTEAAFKELNRVTIADAESILGRIFARFWGVNWTLNAVIALYREFYRENEKLTIISNSFHAKLATTKVKTNITSINRFINYLPIYL